MDYRIEWMQIQQIMLCTWYIRYQLFIVKYLVHTCNVNRTKTCEERCFEFKFLLMTFSEI